MIATAALERERRRIGLGEKAQGEGDGGCRLAAARGPAGEGVADSRVGVGKEGLCADHLDRSIGR